MGNININGSGTYSTLNSAVAAASGGDTINITGTWSSHDTTNVTWDIAVSVRADSDSKQDGKAWQTGDTTYRLRPTSGHVFTVTGNGDDVDIEDINIISDSTGNSDEIVRLGTKEADVTFVNCIIGFSSVNYQQDIIYYEGDNDTVTFSLTSCQVFGVDRSVIDCYTNTNTTITVNLNSNTFHDIGSGGGRQNGQIYGEYTGSGTIIINAFNNLINLEGLNTTPVRYAYVVTAGKTTTLNSDYNIYNGDANDLESNVDTVNTTGDGYTYTFTEAADPGSGSKVGLRDITTLPYDLRLTDHANNDAIDFHSIETGPDSGLALPNDIIGTVRGAAEDHDVGAFEIAAAGDLSIDISQSVNVTENLTLAAESVEQFLEINLFQQIELSESVTGFLNLGDILALENIDLSENILPEMNLGAISINEVMGLAESLTSGVPLKFSKFENITLTEFLALLETIAPSKFENITVAEYLALLKDIGLSDFENINVVESVTAALTATGLDVFDSVSVTEFISILKDIGLDTAQAITVEEVISAFMLLAGLEVSQQITINEAITAFINLGGIDATQAINISEIATGLLNLAGIDISQSVNVSEYLNVLTTSDFPISGIYENITITEAITLLLGFLPLSESETVNVTESVTTILSVAGVDASQNINLSEYINLIAGLGLIFESETISISEAITAMLEVTGANVYDGISISEFIQNILEVTGINVSQSVTISEYVYVTTVLVSGLLRVGFSMFRPKIIYTASKPGAIYTTSKPKINFTGGN